MTSAIFSTEEKMRKQRSKNFGRDSKLLADLYAQFHATIVGPLGYSVSKQNKRQAWISLTDQFNEQAENGWREVDEIRMKMKNLKDNARIYAKEKARYEENPGSIYLKPPVPDADIQKMYEIIYCSRAQNNRRHSTALIKSTAIQDTNLDSAHVEPTDFQDTRNQLDLIPAVLNGVAANDNDVEDRKPAIFDAEGRLGFPGDSLVLPGSSRREYQRLSTSSSSEISECLPKRRKECLNDDTSAILKDVSAALAGKSFHESLRTPGFSGAPVRNSPEPLRTSALAFSSLQNPNLESQSGYLTSNDSRIDKTEAVLAGTHRGTPREYRGGTHSEHSELQTELLNQRLKLVQEKREKVREERVKIAKEQYKIELETLKLTAELKTMGEQIPNKPSFEPCDRSIST